MDATGQMRTNDKPYGIEKFISAEVARARFRKIEKKLEAACESSARVAFFLCYLYVLHN